LEPLAFIVYHLDAVLRQNLGDFLGVQEIENMIERWAAENGQRDLVQAALSDSKLRLKFARILRALSEEQVPITSWKEILEAFQAEETGKTANIIRAARLRLKQSLPGNRPGVDRVELPVECRHSITGWVTREEGKPRFDPPALEKLEFLRTIGKLVETKTSRVAIIVEDPLVRPFVQSLVESRFPYLLVLSREELLQNSEESAVEAKDESEAKGD
jgi:flagellar biosynthesis component FlhA